MRDYGSGQVYLDANTLARSLLRAGLDVRVRGWVNPELRVGKVALRLGTASRPVDAYNLYSLALAPWRGSWGCASRTAPAGAG